MLLFLSRLLRVLIVLLVVRFLMRSLGAFFRARRERAVPPAPAPPAGKVTAGELVRDRVCNTFLPRERALSATIGGQQEHFCSAACRDRALLAERPA